MAVAEGCLVVTLGLSDIMRLIPHRPPALFIRDATISTDGDGKPLLTATAFFDHPELAALHDGHFSPEQRILMGVLPQEAIQQALAILAAHTSSSQRGNRRVVLTGAQKVGWGAMIKPSDQLMVTVRIDTQSRASVTGSGSAQLNGETVCTVEGIEGRRLLASSNDNSGSGQLELGMTD